MKHLITCTAILFALGASTAGARPPDPANASALRLYTLDCGLTEFKDADVFSDTGEYEGKYLALPTPCYLIRHGKEWMLWDTGLSDKLAAEPKGKEIFGGRFSVKRTLTAQLAALGLKPADIRYVGMSHLHFDHTGNVGLFLHRPS